VSSGFRPAVSQPRSRLQGMADLAPCVLSRAAAYSARGRPRVKDRASARPVWPAPEASLTRVTARG
jgi:hypothetical protein